VKVYHGHRAAGRAVVGFTVTTDLTETPQPLQHRLRHSPDGFEWGYGGSGPSDLALAILWDHLGTEPPPRVYQTFKFDVVAKLGDEWALTEAAIATWLRDNFPPADPVAAP
jgi:hypothetical protein